jgi:AraC-like DNA-binding protein
VTWSTTEAQPDARYANWQEALDASHHAWRLDDRTPASFSAALASTTVDDLQIVRCACDPCRGSRGGREIAADRGAFFGLLLVQDGCEEVTVDAKTFSIEPGMGLLWDSTAPIRFRLLSPIRKLTVFLGQDRLLSAIPNALDRLLRPLDWRSGIGAVAGAYIRSLSAEATHIDADRGPAAAEMLLDLISGDLDQPGAAPLSSTQARLLARADAHIAARLDDVDLGPQSIAADLGISVRSLHLLYSRRGATVSRHILERRLERCRRDLVIEPRLSITEIAFRWGFNDMAHFSRAFRRQHGETASAYRGRFSRNPAGEDPSIDEA